MDISDINLNKKNILAYMGAKNSSMIVFGELDEMIMVAKTIVKPKFTYEIFDIEVNNDCVKLQNCDLKLVGFDIAKHLKTSTKCALMAVTLGHEIDRKVKSLMSTDMVNGVFLDAISSELVEVVCDICEKEIIDIASKQGLQTVFRYSPGYGDFPLSVQKDFVKTIFADKKLGIVVNDNFFMQPYKSVTAVVGFCEKVTTGSRCDYCLKKDRCKDRLEGNYCGN